MVNAVEVISFMQNKFLPKTQSGRDILLLIVLIVPLAIAGVIWGILGDFSTPREPLTPTPVEAPATPSASPAAFFTIESH